ncbi:MAG TPA: hypothetical protein VMW25_02620, partial [Clostridia bacterium]|nr:hypothetical protein [Clostridia bacterium]
MTSIDEFFGDYLKVDELKGEKKLKIKEVKIETLGRGGDAKEKPVVYFEGLDKGLALNRINADALKEICGSAEIESWPGNVVVLYVDPNVQFSGRRVGGIRVRVPSQGVGPEEAK